MLSVDDFSVLWMGEPSTHLTYGPGYVVRHRVAKFHWSRVNTWTSPTDLARLDAWREWLWKMLCKRVRYWGSRKARNAVERIRRIWGEEGVLQACTVTMRCVEVS